MSLYARTRRHTDSLQAQYEIGLKAKLKSIHPKEASRSAAAWTACFSRRLQLHFMHKGRGRCHEDYADPGH
jgi:hypothetical protein